MRTPERWKRKTFTRILSEGESSAKVHDSRSMLYMLLKREKRLWRSRTLRQHGPSHFQPSEKAGRLPAWFRTFPRDVLNLNSKVRVFSEKGGVKSKCCYPHAHPRKMKKENVYSYSVRGRVFGESPWLSFDAVHATETRKTLMKVEDTPATRPFTFPAKRKRQADCPPDSKLDIHGTSSRSL